MTDAQSHESKGDNISISMTLGCANGTRVYYNFNFKIIQIQNNSFLCWKTVRESC